MKSLSALLAAAMLAFTAPALTLESVPNDTTQVWTALDPFAIGVATNALGLITNSYVTVDGVAYPVTAGVSVTTTNAVPKQTTVTFNGVTGGLHTNLTFTGATVAQGALADTAIQPSATNGWNVAPHDGLLTNVTSLTDSQDATYFYTLENGTGTVWRMARQYFRFTGDTTNCFLKFPLQAQSDNGWTVVYEDNRYRATWVNDGVTWEGTSEVDGDPSDVNIVIVLWDGYDYKSVFVPPASVVFVAEFATRAELTSLEASLGQTITANVSALNAGITAVSNRVTTLENTALVTSDIRDYTTRFFCDLSITNTATFAALTNRAPTVDATLHVPFVTTNTVFAKFRLPAYDYAVGGTMVVTNRVRRPVGSAVYNWAAQLCSYVGATRTVIATGDEVAMPASGGASGIERTTTVAVPATVVDGKDLSLEYVVTSADAASSAYVLSGPSYNHSVIMPLRPTGYASIADNDLKLSRTGGTATNLSAVGTFAVNGDVSATTFTSGGTPLFVTVTNIAYFATNGLVSASITNGLSSTNFVNTRLTSVTLAQAYSNGNFAGTETIAPSNINARSFGWFAGFGAKSDHSLTNHYFGYRAGQYSSGRGNSFYGYGSGYDSSGVLNSYYGYWAGEGFVGEGSHCDGYHSGSQANGTNCNYYGHYSGSLSVGWESQYFGYYAGNRAAGNRSSYFGYISGDQAIGNDNTYLGLQSGSGANGNLNDYIGSSAGAGAQGDNNAYVGQTAGYQAATTNSAFFGITVGENARGSNRLYIDVYSADPAHAAGGATNDMIFGDNGQLNLGRSGALTNATPNVLRGSWTYNGLPFLSSSVTNGLAAYSITNGLVSGTSLSALAYVTASVTNGLATTTYADNSSAAKLDRASGTATNLTVSGTLSMLGYPWAWDSEFHTYNVGLDGGVTGQLFQEQHIYAKNKSGSTLAEGRAVTVAGAVGDNVLVGYADCANILHKWTTIGLVTQTDGIANNDAGYVTTFGNVNDLDTSSWAVSNTLWLASNGTLTNVEPAISLTGCKVKIGTVLRSHANDGRVFVSVLSIPDWSDAGAVALNSGTATNLTAFNVSVPYLATNRYLLADGAEVGWVSVSSVSNLQMKTAGGTGIVIAPSGRIGINGLPTATGSYGITLSGDVAPGVNNGSYLGASSFRWNSIYVGSGGLDLTGPIVGTAATPITTLNTVSASNFVFRIPRWVDEKIGGMQLSPSPSAAPTQVETVSASGVYGLGWDIGDWASFSLQMAHGMAETNSLFPNLYYGPHLHVSSTATDGGANKATFVMKWQIAAVNGDYNGTLARTQTVTFAAANTHYLCDFGVVTNNAFSGRDSVVARGTIYRIAGADDVGANVAITDSVDFHIPVREYGSVSINGD